MWGEVSGTKLLSKPLKRSQEQITHWAADNSVVQGHFQLMKQLFNLWSEKYFLFYNFQAADDAIA